MTGVFAIQVDRPYYPPTRAIRVGFTGTQRGLAPSQRKTLAALVAAWPAGCEAHHGDCIGADAQFHTIVTSAGWSTVGHPPIDPKKRANCLFTMSRDPCEYRVRNEAIVVESEIMIATPGQSTEQLRSGTWMTVRLARRHQKARRREDGWLPLYVIYPDGSLVVEDGLDVLDGTG